MRLFALLSLLVCAAGASLTGPAHAVQTLHTSKSTGRPILQVSPVRVPLGQAFSVVLTSGRPGVRYAFVTQPASRTGGFGGGLMGRYTADRQGVVRFGYRAGIKAWEAGPWRISAERADGVVVATATILFIRPTSDSASASCVARAPTGGAGASATLALVTPHMVRGSATSDGAVDLCRVTTAGRAQPLYHTLLTGKRQVSVHTGAAGDGRRGWSTRTFG